MRRSIILGVILSVSLPLTGGSTGAPQEAAETASLRGTVTDSKTGQPIAGAVIDLPESGRRDSATTDGEGRFELRTVEGTGSRIGVAAPGYADKALTVDLRSGRTATRQIALAPLASIEGRLLDRDGRPLAGITVQALQFQYPSFGERKLTVAGSGASDDRGIYRIFWIPAGRYFLLAANVSLPSASSNSVVDVVGPAFFPGVPAVIPDEPERSLAATVALNAGDELEGVNFLLARGTTRRIRGRIVDGSASGLLEDPRLYLLQPWTQGVNTRKRSAKYEPRDGGFEFRGSSGPGLITVSDGSTVLAAASIDAGNSDIDDLIITVSTPQPIRVHVTVEGPGGGDSLDGMSVDLQPWNDAGTWIDNENYSETETPLEEGDFEISGLASGAFRVVVKGDAYVKEARWGSVDVRNAPMEVAPDRSQILDLVISFNTAHVGGSIVDRDSEPCDDCFVVLMPTAHRERMDLYSTVETGAHFGFDHVPPGDYKLFAWRRTEENLYFDPAFVRAYEDKGQPVHVDAFSQFSAIELKVLQ